VIDNAEEVVVGDVNGLFEVDGSEEAVVEMKNMWVWDAGDTDDGFGGILDVFDIPVDTLPNVSESDKEWPWTVA
jgi:hypothetical protein